MLNIARVQIPGGTLRAGVLPYGEDGHERLAELRREHRATHAVARRRDEIICLPRTSDAPNLGEGRDFGIEENLGLVATLFREALIDRFHGLNRTVVGYRPITVLGGARHDLLRAALPSGIEAPPWLAILPRFEFDARLFFFADQRPFLGVALDVRTKRRITAPCSELAGINFTGLYVGRRDESVDPRVEAPFRLLGRVESHTGETLSLVDARDNSDRVPASVAYLEPSARAVAVLIDQLFTDRAEEVRQALLERSAARRVGPAKLAEIRKVREYLAKEPLEICPGMEVTLSPYIGGQALPRVAQAPKPVYVLDPTGAKTDTWADRGIQRNGPYSKQTFSKNRPRIAVICQAATKGRVEQFLQKFFHGLRHPNPKRHPFDDGLIGKYRLDGVAPKFYLASDASAGAYQRAAREAIEEAAAASGHWDLAVVQIERQFRDRVGETNPYLVTKHEFLTHQTPVQEFTLETASLQDGQLAYALNNMALATYSKLGGTPWLLECDRGIAHELVIGIGSANVGEGRLGDRERVVGFTTVFSGDGNYRVANRSRAVRGAAYQDELLVTLRGTVETVSRDMNWQAGDHVRLVFHSSFKKFRDAEAAAVKNLMSDLGDFDVEFAFLEVSQEHPYLLFDETQTGVHDYETKSNKGVFAPERGKMIALSRRETLLVLTGPRDVKRVVDGMPSPVLLRLHHDSTFTDMTYLARQIYAFANHSWRSFFPGSIPVTIQYSDLIAGLLGELGKLPGWNSSVLLGRIGASRWFL